MSSNPYAPPQARVEDIHDVVHATPPFFAVSLTKFIVLNMCTFGIYRVYWIYKNWTLIKEREGLDINPVARSVLSIFYVYSLFRRIRNEGERLGISSLPSAGLLYALWWPLILASRLPGVYSLITYLSVFIFVPMQHCANKINAHAVPEHDPNSRFTGWNWFAVIAGIPLFILTGYGLTLPD